MKQVIIAIVVFVSGFTTSVAYQSINAEFSCPEGSYQIGEDVCKAEPTGCPYGDSIPIDSEKCVPTTKEEIEAYKPIEPIQPIEEAKQITNERAEQCK